MANIISILVILGLVFTAAFFQLSAIIWTLLIAVPLILLAVFGFLNVVSFIILFTIFLLAAAFANLSQLRQKFLLVPNLGHMKKQLPTISNTERAAIEAGDAWWEKDLFCGRPNWKKLFAIPKPTLSAEEQNFLDNQVEELCSMINDWEINNNVRDLTNEIWNYLKHEKFFGMVIPKEYGGLGFSALAHSTVVTKIASRSISTAVTAMVPNSLGPGELILYYGTDEQKNYYLPRLANGAEIPCFALTAPDAGSDAGAIPDTGIVCRRQYNGRETLGICLSWDKRYITLAPVATVLGLAIHLYDPDHLLGNKEDVGITLCLIPTSHPGVEIGNRHYPMGLAFMNGPTRGKDVFIPLDWIIGGVNMAGEGWRMLMECLSIGRSISLPALSTASAKKTYRLTGAYSRIRRQFNASLATFEGIEEALVYIAGYTYLTEACRIMTAGAIDQNVHPSTVSAIAKYQMTEMARKIVLHAMDIHAGHTIQEGPRNFLANFYTALPISITVEGANILTRNLIIFGQGAIRCHPYVLKEVELLSSPQPDIKSLDRVLISHIGFFTSNLLRTLAYGWTGGLFIMTPVKNRLIKPGFKQLTRMSAALALLADTCMIIFGGSLKRRERLSARLGDILSQLYLGSTVLKYFHDNNELASDVPYVRWCIQECLYRIQIACDELLANFPHPWLASLLHFIIFPFGRAYPRPKDIAGKNLLPAMLTNSELRDRLTRYCYVSDKEDDLTTRLDKALHEITTMEALWDRLNKAVQKKMIPERYHFTERVKAAQEAGIVSAEEARMLNEYETLRQEIIKVDEFSFNLDKVISD